MHRYEIDLHKLCIVQTKSIADDSRSKKSIHKKVIESICRFLSHDWGDATESSKEMNDLALDTGDDILGIYPVSENQKIWLVLDPSTGMNKKRILTIMYPDEY